MDRKKSQTSSLYGQKGLILRYSETSGLEDAKDRLIEVVSLFPDKSAPLEPEHVLGKLDEVLSQYVRHATYGDGIRPAIGAVQEI